jgi:hypothetical protein
MREVGREFGVPAEPGSQPGLAHVDQAWWGTGEANVTSGCVDEVYAGIGEDDGGYESGDRGGMGVRVRVMPINAMSLGKAELTVRYGGGI